MFNFNLFIQKFNMTNNKSNLPIHRVCEQNQCAQELSLNTYWKLGPLDWMIQWSLSQLSVTKIRSIGYKIVDFIRLFNCQSKKFSSSAGMNQKFSKIKLFSCPSEHSLVEIELWTECVHRDLLVIVIIKMLQILCYLSKLKGKRNIGTIFKSWK